jgi:HSP20 family protein
MPNPTVKLMRVYRRDLSGLLQDLNDQTQPFYLVEEETLWHPSCDVYETDRELVVKLELAGISKEEIGITFVPGSLVIRGTRLDSAGQDAQRFYHKIEINQGWFEKVIPLPETVSDQVVSSVYRDGMLEIRLAKKASRTIEIKID